MKRALLAAASLAITVAACGGSNPAEDYIDGLNDIVTTGFADFEAASVAHRQITNPTMNDSVAFLEQEIAIRRVFHDGFEALDPPEAITEVHQAVGDAFARLLAATERVVAVADTVDNLQELEQTPEFAEYQAANADGAVVCLDVQAKFDDLAANSEAFRDDPWLSSVALTVQVALRCTDLETG